jgi:diguanylate cyclase (GGDEF)-like protein
VKRLFARQIAKATKASGEVDMDLLENLVVSAYEQSERDRNRTDRSISLMVDELDKLNRGLENLVEERTAALRDREARLAEQKKLADAALNNMSHGLLMFDADAKMMVCNRRYLELYGLSPDRVKPGVTVQELLEARAETGTFVGDPHNYAATLRSKIANNESYGRLVELPDGRTISIVSRPMEGGGWVVTHEDVSDRRRAEKKIAHMAHHDALTDLPNRVLYRERLAEALTKLNTDERLAVFYLDLDNFKAVNDTLGHQIGDELLKSVADRLRGCMHDTTTVARVGGDEFAIILPELAQLNDAALLAQKVCEAIRQPYNLFGHAIVTDTSIGIAIAPDDGVDPDELLKNADMALYGAKADGRGTFRFFEPEMDARVKARRALENSLRVALAEGEFILHYQPIMDLSENNISCCEALIRWNHPERGLLGPGEFIPVAEETGLIVAIGEWVLRTACAEAATWPNGVRVAVNLSPIQMTNPNLMSVVISALAGSGLPANHLELEITESVMMQNTDATLATLHRLRILGVKISMDDFGTGFSSLSYLRRFPFDKLKIDRSFIGDLSKDEDALAIVRAVTAMAKSLRMITTAEGVETSEQLGQVRSLGCTEVQGFFIGRPQRREEIARLLADYVPRSAKRA